MSSSLSGDLVSFLMKPTKVKIRFWIGAVVAIALVATTVSSVVDNTTRLYGAGAHRLQMRIPRQEIGRKAAQYGRLELYVYNLNFGSGSSYDPAYIEDYLNSAFTSLGIKLDVAYERVDVHKGLEKKLGAGANEAGETAGKEPFDNKAELSEFVEYTKTGVGPENYLGGGERDVAVFITSLENPSQKATETVTGKTVYSTYTISNAPVSIVIYTRNKRGEYLSETDTARDITHEVGHAIGLNHASFWPFDIMSYSSLWRETTKRFPRIAFGLESLIEWQVIKKEMMEKAGP